MWFVALKNLLQERTKLFISIGGVAFSVALVVLLNGLYQGWNESLGGYPRSIYADLWVEQDGVGDMFHALSFLPNTLTNQLAAVEGVNQVYPYLGRQTQIHVKGDDTSLFVVGFNPANGFGKPKGMKEGNWENLRDGEIIIDDVFAKKFQLSVGDELTISEEKLKIAAISTGGNMMVFQYAFVTLSEAAKVFGLRDTVNFYLLTVEAGADVERIKMSIRDSIPGVKVLTKQEFVDASRKMIVESFLPVIYVLVLLSLAVGGAVIGITIYSATVEKAREYGMMKAVGVSNRQLYVIVIVQSLVSAIIGYVIGVTLSFPIATLAQYAVPGFLTEFRTIDVAWVFGATMALAVIASYLPVRRLASIDPAEVFKN